MRRLIRSLKLRFAELTGYAGYYFWRGMERGLGVAGFYRVARTFYTGRATFNELFRRPKPWEKPEWLRTDDSLRTRIRRRTRKYLDTLLKSFSDRLVRPEWRSRCRFEGAEYLHQAKAAGRPVVLAFFHFGPFYLLQPWMRAYGFRMTAFTGGTLESRGRFRGFQDRGAPFPDVPMAYFPGQLRAVRKFLEAGNILMIAMDTPAARQTISDAYDGWAITVSAGAARLAHQTGADLMLASIINEGPWRYRVKFSPPIPGAGLQTEADWAAANRRLVAAALPDFKAHSEQFEIRPGWHRPM